MIEQKDYYIVKKPNDTYIAFFEKELADRFSKEYGSRIVEITSLCGDIFKGLDYQQSQEKMKSYFNNK